MATKLVLDALQTLHQELDKMQPSIRQVEIAERVIEEARKIPEQYLKLVNHLEGQEQHFKQNLIDDLNKHTGQVTKQVNALMISAAGTMENLSEREKQIDASRKKLEQLISQLSGLNEEEGKNRRHQLESNANGIKQEIRQSHDKFSTIETSLISKIHDMGSMHQGETNAIRQDVRKMQTNLGDMTTQLLSRFDEVEKQQKTQKMFTFITWALIVAAAAVCLYLK